MVMKKNLNQFIQEFRKEFLKLSPEDIAYPRSVNGVGKFYGFKCVI